MSSSSPQGTFGSLDQNGLSTIVGEALLSEQQEHSHEFLE
jgi:hypothetical protein